MALHLVLAFAGAAIAGTALAASPDSGTTTPPTQQMTDAEAFSATAGRVLGAASVCDDIADDRINDAANKVGAAIEKMISDDDEMTSVHQMFLEGISEGGDAISNGATDCGKVERALAEMERGLPKESQAR